MLLTLVRLYSLLPLSWVRGAGRLLGWLIYALDSRYRRLVRTHLRMAGQGGDAVRRAAIAGVGASLAEGPWLWGHSAADLARRVVCDQLPMMKALAESGQPVLFLTPHLGAFEMTARYYSAFGPITVLYREPQIAALRRFMAQVRMSGRMRAAPASLGGVKTMLKALKAGEAIGILPDQVPGAGEGQWTPFFGKPAYTMSLPERLARTTGARVILAVGEPLPSGGAAQWRLHLEAMDEAPTPEAINRRFEQLILSMPHLYLWGYNRYKHPAGAPLPPGGLEAHRSSHD